MRVSEIAKKALVTPDTVRHYTRIGLISAERNPDNDYQLYDNTALQRLKFIRQATELGFSLKQVENILQQSDSGDSPCPMVRDLLQQKVPETKAKIAQLQAHLAKMETALAAWESMPDGVPNGHSICCLIEDWEGVSLQDKALEDCHDGCK
ncbi:MerR family transcriptional regulator [Marinomonas posidonica]|uniref:Transcriptional regulator, MerR family n=1 Tax=Marinomonas posidonica (strain CECT 7376 / NCIMB 14433 / IVIA-Po-181) TaxID=491952 RepID=F6D003_MARPP|nr:MerR family transcriptional regulator [Marinomonas posidonica]AEF54743.1 transcriptional regulator, MerR family [Marinomonas posidonica IVIA-Po-181]